MRATKPKRIMIFGRPGTGKSTFALQLHNKSKIPLYHLDKYFFKENWVERDYQDFLDIQQSIASKDEWIIDGNATKSLEMRWERADLVLFFNYSKLICLYRLLKRLFYKNKEIDDRAEGCNERVRLVLLKYMWGFENRVKAQIEGLKEKYPSANMIEIKNDSDLDKIKLSLF